MVGGQPSSEAGEGRKVLKAQKQGRRGNSREENRMSLFKRFQLSVRSKCKGKSQ